MARTRKSLQSAGARYQSGVAGAGEAYRTGVQNATGYVEGSMRASNRRNTGLQQAIADGRIDRGIQRVGDAGWKAATVSKGAPAYTGAASRAASAFLQGLQKTYGFLDQADQAVAGMPEDTVEQRIAKAGAYQLAVHRAAQQSKGQ